MMFAQLMMVLLANGVAFFLRRQYRHEQWRSLHVASAAAIMTGAGFLVLLDLYFVFDVLEHVKPVQASLRLLYVSLILFGLSLVSFLSLFYSKSNS